MEREISERGTSESIVPSDLVGGLTGKNRRRLLLPLKMKIVATVKKRGSVESYCQRGVGSEGFSICRGSIKKV